MLLAGWGPAGSVWPVKDTPGLPVDHFQRRGALSMALDETATIQAEEIQKQIENSEANIRAYRQNLQTRANFKAALNEYGILLAYNLPLEKRSRYEQERVELQHQYEAFLAEFQELQTARQLANLENELIAIRKLMVKGKDEDDDGNNLASQFAKLLDKLAKTLLETTSEKDELAQKQSIVTMNTLQETQATGVIGIYHNVIELLEGKGISEPDTSLETVQAIAGIRNFLAEREDIREKTQHYRARLAIAEQLQETIKEVRSIYNDAQDLFGEANYFQTVEKLEEVADHTSEHFKSSTIDGLRRRATERWVIQELKRAVDLESRARTQLALEAYEEARQHATQLANLGKDIKGLKNVEEEQQREIEAHRETGKSLLEDIEKAKVSSHLEKKGQAKNVARNLIDLARQYIESKKYLDALDALAEARQRDPDNEDIESVGHGLRERVREVIDTTIASAQSTPDRQKLREFLIKRDDLQHRLGQVFTESPTPAGEPSLQVSDLDAWEQAMQEATSLFAQADAARTTAEQAEKDMLCSEAEQNYRGAENTYRKISRMLSGPSAISDSFASSYRALKHLREDAREQEEKAKTVASTCQDGCEQAMKRRKDATNFLQQAEEALRSRYYYDAEEVSEQALTRCNDLPEEMQERARKIIRASRQLREDERPSFLIPSRIVLVALLLIVIGIAGLLGPGFWQWLTAI
jgi:hypothetical protein